MTEFAKGGFVPRSDAEPIKVRLSKGCFYSSDAVAHHGEEFMAKLNEMKMPDFPVREED